MWNHLAVHLRSDKVLVTEPRVAPALWATLRRAFPIVAGALLMPDHLHVIPWGKSARSMRIRMARALSGFSRSRHCGGAPPEWASIAAPKRIEDRIKLARHVRYLALNPCREGLSGDPLE